MITITDSAQLKIKEMIEHSDKNHTYLRFSVQGGGCSGLNYGLGFDDEQKDSDEKIIFKYFSVLLKKEDFPILNNTMIDYKENLMGGGFIINNPNAIATCGCGSSFKTKDNDGKPEEC